MKRSFAIAVGLCALIAVSACQSAPKGPSDEELIAGVLANWKTAVEATDLEALMATYSDNFQGERGEDKAGLRSFLEQAINMGYLENSAVDIEGAETSIEEGSATISGVQLMTAMGTMNLTLELVKEEAGWGIVGSQTQQ